MNRRQILSGCHLIKTQRGVASPLVEVEVCGTENDSERYKVPASIFVLFRFRFIDIMDLDRRPRIPTTDSIRVGSTPARDLALTSPTWLRFRFALHAL